MHARRSDISKILSYQALVMMLVFFHTHQQTTRRSPTHEEVLCFRILIRCTTL
uniref:Uncharacterized protein n=1 Tax=Arundo donax TaxID=35708 RepID=A0A0A9F2Q5_ARUDO